MRTIIQTLCTLAIMTATLPAAGNAATAAGKAPAARPTISQGIEGSASTDGAGALGYSGGRSYGGRWCNWHPYVCYRR
jgi:hypothetical protein